MGLHQGRIWPLEATFRAKAKAPGHHPAARRAMSPVLTLSCSAAAPAAGRAVGLPAIQVSANLFQAFKNTEQFVLRL